MGPETTVTAMTCSGRPALSSWSTSGPKVSARPRATATEKSREPLRTVAVRTVVFSCALAVTDEATLLGELSSPWSAITRRAASSLATSVT